MSNDPVVAIVGVTGAVGAEFIATMDKRGFRVGKLKALASAFNLPTRKPRLSMVAMNSAPTAPVTPTIATTGSLLTWLSISSGCRH